MEIEKSRNGFYTVTFINKNDLDESQIQEEFSTVGNVCKVVKNYQRVFVRYREKEEAEKAIAKFGKLYDVQVAKNNDSPTEGGRLKARLLKKHDSNSSPGTNNSSSSSSMDGQCSGPCNVNTGFHLILANLPKDYSVKDVNALVKESNPLHINDLGDTRVFRIRAFHIVLDSQESLIYLINKLDGFVICGEKLNAIEAKNLLQWRNGGS